jgi:hypothetical protein
MMSFQQELQRAEQEFPEHFIHNDKKDIGEKNNNAEAQVVSRSGHRNPVSMSSTCTATG